MLHRDYQSLSHPQVVTNDSSKTSKYNDERDSAHTIPLRVCKEQKSTGKLKEDVHISGYEEACGDYYFPSEQHLKYVHSLFYGEVKKFIQRLIF